jgi:erythromycin esterase-like protein
MALPLKKFLASGLLLSGSFGSALAQPATLPWLNTHVHPLLLSAQASENDLAFLGEQLRGKSLCGLGEASHGTHEFYVAKTRLIHYLVTQLHYQQLGFEYEAGAIESLNTYVHTGTGDLRALLRPLHLYATEEVYQLLQWLRTYNQTKAVDAQVSLFGFDTNYTPAYQAAAATACRTYLQGHPTQFLAAAAAEPVLTKIAASNTSILFDLAEPEVVALQRLVTQVQASPSTLDPTFAPFAQQLALLYQGTLLSDPLARDQFMATNIAARQPAGKTIIWGHNLHLAKDTTMTGYRGTGFYLRRRYGSQYYALGFDTYQGQVNVLADGHLEAHPFIAKPTSLSAQLAHVKYPNFLLAAANNSPAPLGLGNQQITNINANWTTNRELPIRLGIDFDGLVFIRETTASLPLK